MNKSLSTYNHLFYDNQLNLDLNNSSYVNMLKDRNIFIFKFNKTKATCRISNFLIYFDTQILSEIKY